MFYHLYTTFTTLLHTAELDFSMPYDSARFDAFYNVDISSTNSKIVLHNVAVCQAQTLSTECLCKAKKRHLSWSAHAVYACYV